MKLNRIVITLVLLIIVGAAGFFIYQQQVGSARAAAVANRQTATITRGTLVSSVSGAGNLYAPQQTNLNFQLAGVPIVKIDVQVGDKVKAGDVLAQEDDSDLQFALRSAQSGLASAQANLAKLQQPPLQADVDAAKASVASAQSAFDAAVKKSADVVDQVAPSKAALDNAAAALQQAQAAYDSIAWRPGASTSSQALTLAQDTNNYQSALSAYNLAVLGVNDSAVKQAAQQLSSAEDSLVKLMQPATSQDLAVAQASVDNAQVQVDQATRKLNQAKIIAPFDGTIASVNYVVGQLSPSGSTTVISLVNLDNLQTQITVSEVDIAKVQMGQQVSLSFDALNGGAFPGKILSISPVGTVTQGVVNYVVTVGLSKTDPSIMPGMTASATIVAQRHDNVLMAPNRAVRTQGNRRMITILFEGREIPVFVQTGLTNDTDTEILSATATDGTAVTLQDGDTLVLNPTTPTTGGGRGVPGGGGILFGRGG